MYGLEDYTAVKHVMQQHRGVTDRGAPDGGRSG
jgi:hypothetical protein